MSYTSTTASAVLEPVAKKRAPQNRIAPQVPYESQEELLLQYLPLVKSTVSRIKIGLPPHIEEEDLQSVGLAGLISALKRYDPDQKDSFASYATMRIRGAILDELRRMDWMPRNARANFKALRKTVEDLEQELGRPATEEEIRTAMNLSPKAYSDLLDSTRTVSLIPLDHSPNGESTDEGSLYEVIADDNLVSATDRMEKEELIQMVAKRINQLPEIPRKVLAMYYYENMRLAEIAAVFGLTESRICQIHSQAVVSLRTYLTAVMHK
jgi:RNA polymerase sigma factor for flagellar operon FliA